MNVMSSNSTFNLFDKLFLKSFRKVILFIAILFIAIESYSQATSICEGNIQTLVNPNPGGYWTSLDLAIATVDIDGVVTGISPGSCDVQYTDLSSVVTTFPIIVDEMILVSPISGPQNVCLNSSIILSNTIAGGIWSSSNPLIIDVTVDGVVTGLAEGTATISYTFNNGSCQSIETIDITVLPLPIMTDIFGLDPSTGEAIICINSSVSLLNATPAGEWSSSDPLIAAVDVDGFVTGIAVGTVIIEYNVLLNTCIAFDTVIVHVVAPSTLFLTSASLSDSQTVCLGSSISSISYGFTGSSSSIVISDVNPDPFDGNVPSGIIGTFSGDVFTIDGTPTQSGSYFFTVSTYGGICDFEAQEIVYMIIDSLPNMDFSYAMSGLDVDFTNLSTNNDLSFYWDFSVGNSSLTNPSYTFPSFGSYTVTLTSQNHCGSQSVSKVIGVNELNNLSESTFSVLPNPFVNQLNLQFKTMESAQITILDLTGKILFDKEYKQESITLNLEDLTSGQYLLKVKQDSKNTVQKIIKL